MLAVLWGKPQGAWGGWEKKRKYFEEEFGFLMGEGGCDLVHYGAESLGPSVKKGTGCGGGGRVGWRGQCLPLGQPDPNTTFTKHLPRAWPVTSRLPAVRPLPSGKTKPR